METFARKLAGFVLALALLSTLVACASEQTPSEDPQPPANEQPSGQAGEQQDPAELTRTKCTRCHSFDRVEQAKKDRPGWERTVDRMIGNGLEVTAAEKQAIIDYLSERDQ